MPDPSVWIVVLNWRDAEATAACLASVGAPDYRNFRVLVIDSASRDEPDAQFVGMAGIGVIPVEVIRSPTNLGFTGGVNLGIRQAISGNADYVWLLNSDATLEPETLSRLVATAQADPSTVYHHFKTPTESPSRCPPHLHYYMSRNYPLLWRKHFGSFLFRKSTIWFLHQRLLQVRGLDGDEICVAALLAGLWDGFMGRSGPFSTERQMPWPLRMIMHVVGAVWLRGIAPGGHARVR